MEYVACRIRSIVAKSCSACSSKTLRHSMHTQGSSWQPMKRRISVRWSSPASSTLKKNSKAWNLGPCSPWCDTRSTQGTGIPAGSIVHCGSTPWMMASRRSIMPMVAHRRQCFTDWSRKWRVFLEMSSRHFAWSSVKDALTNRPRTVCEFRLQLSGNGKTVHYKDSTEHQSGCRPDTGVQLESQRSKHRVRCRLLKEIQSRLDDVESTEPWRDSSPSGEFEAVLS